MTTLAEITKTEAQALRKKFPNLTPIEAADIVRFTMNRYVGHANFHALIMSQPLKIVGCKGRDAKPVEIHLSNEQTLSFNPDDFNAGSV